MTTLATLSLLTSFASLLMLSSGESTTPNIVFLILDDVSFSDVSYNGGPMPTPFLDTLANNNAMKLNYHYTETTCSPSRSSLYTGRYAFKSGLNQNAQHRVGNTIDTNLVLYPQLLHANNAYNTFFAGKWHVGYTYSDMTPPNRGFDDGLYGLNRVAYTSRSASSNWNTYDSVYPTSAQRVLNQRNSLFPNPPNLHELWKVSNGVNAPDGLGANNDTYVEILYTNAILQFLDDQTNNQPFYIQYNFLTPHSPLTEPPALDPNWLYDYTICDIAVLPAEQQLFCRMMLYAQERMDEIIEATRNKGFYDNTVFVVIADNPHNQGTSMPFRGTKGTFNEGGIRTPAFMFGGYIEGLFSNSNATQSECEYNGMVHISDWYNIFTELAGITHSESDSDHSSLQILDDMKCACGIYPNCADGTFQKRTELISMRLCGNDDTLAIDSYPDKVYHAAYIIDWPWKLIVNGSLGAGNLGCSPNDRQTNSWQRPNSINYYNNILYTEPNQQFYDTYYEPRINAGFGHLFQSQCLESLDGSTDIDDPNYGAFVYEHFMLYNLETDKIEACNVAADNPQIMQDLWTALQAASSGWNANFESDVPNPGAMLAQINSYDCDNDVWFAAPWDGLDEDICGNFALTEDDINARECRNLWRRLIRLKSQCPAGSPLGIVEVDYLEGSVNVFQELAIGIGAVLLIILLGIILVNYCRKRKRKGKLEKDIQDVVKRVEKAVTKENTSGEVDGGIANACSIEFDNGKSMEFGDETVKAAV